MTPPPPISSALGAKGAVPFGDIAWPKLVADFDDVVVPSQLHAAAELDSIYQHERIGAFRVADLLRRLHRRTAACASSAARRRRRFIFFLEQRQRRRSARGPSRRRQQRRASSSHCTGSQAAAVIVNVNFHYQFVALMMALAQYYRDQVIGEAIRGGRRWSSCRSHAGDGTAPRDRPPLCARPVELTAPSWRSPRKPESTSSSFSALFQMPHILSCSMPTTKWTRSIGAELRSRRRP